MSEHSDQELERLLKDVQLKKPVPESMDDYLAGVHRKINQGPSIPAFGIPYMALALALGVALAMFIIFVMKPAPKTAPAVITKETAPLLQKEEPTPVKREMASANLTSLEGQMQILEAMGEDADIIVIDLLTDEELAIEMSFLDDTEMRFLEGNTATPLKG